MLILFVAGRVIVGFLIVDWVIYSPILGDDGLLRSGALGTGLLAAVSRVMPSHRRAEPPKAAPSGPKPALAAITRVPASFGAFVEGREI